MMPFSQRQGGCGDVHSICEDRAEIISQRDHGSVVMLQMSVGVDDTEVEDQVASHVVVT